MRIVFCYNTIRQLGGMEICMVFRANELSRVPGNEVWVVVTERTEEDREAHWKNYSRACVIPFPVRIACNEPSALTEKRVIALGRLFRQKNFISLISIFRIVTDRHQDWELFIYGEGEERENLQNEINRLGLAKKVLLKGRTENVEQALRGASIFALSSIYEGLPNVVIEAMSCGLPVVSYKCPTGPKDMLTDGYDGFLVDNGNEQAFADRLCDLIESYNLRKEMGTNARVSAKRYSPDVCIGKWMSLLGVLSTDS